MSLPAATETATHSDATLLVGGVLLLTVLPFVPTLVTFHPVWLTFTYSHGYVVAAITFWLLWRHRSEIVRDEGGFPAAFVPIVPLSLFWLLASIVNVQVVFQAAVPALLFLWAAAVLGLGAARALVPIGVIFFLAVPVWETIIPPLQAVAIVVCGLAVRVLGIPAEIEGELITIEAGTFQIAQSCAGLAYFMVALLIGTLYAHLYLKTWPGRIAVVAGAAALSVVSNWVRIVGLIVIGEMSQMESSLMEDHDGYGWIIFSLTLPVLFVMARRIELRERAMLSAAEAGEGTSGTRPDGSDADGPSHVDPLPASEDAAEQPEPAQSPASEGPKPARVAPLGRPVALRALLASALVLIGPLVYFMVDLLPRTSPAPPQGPGEASRWAAQVDAPRPYEWVPRYRGVDEHVFQVYSDGQAEIVMDRLIYHEQRQGAELINSENRLAPPRWIMGEALAGPFGTQFWTIHDSVVRTDQEELVRVWWWYRVAGVNTSSASRAKILELTSFFTRNGEAELIALSTPCEPDDCDLAGTTLLNFIQHGGGG